MESGFGIGRIGRADECRNKAESILNQLGLDLVRRTLARLGNAGVAARPLMLQTLGALCRPVLRSLHCHADNGRRVKQYKDC